MSGHPEGRSPHEQAEEPESERIQADELTTPGERGAKGSREDQRGEARREAEEPESERIVSDGLDE